MWIVSCKLYHVVDSTTDLNLMAGLQSSLLHVLLGELPIRSGTIEINGSVSYAAQEPWVFAGTVKQNILFGQPYNRSRYKEVSIIDCFL